MTKGSSVRVIHGFKKPKAPGKYHYLVCLTGENKGLSYYFYSDRIILGRAETNDIQVLDGKCSREHAEITKVGDKFIVTDLGSHNGLIINDLKITQHELSVGDNIVIGQTVYKFSYAEVVEDSKEMETINETNEIQDIDVDEKDNKKSSGEEKKGNRKLVYGAVAALVILFLLPSEPDKKKTKPNRESSSLGEMKIETPLVNDIEDKDVRDKLGAFVHRGQREYREGNYFRAIEQFEMALILVPNHGQASFYLRKSRDSLKAHIKSMEAKAEQETASLRYKNALNQYCAVISFLQNYPEDERYKKAEEKIEILEDKLGYARGEFKCY